MIQRNKADMTVVGEAGNGREAVELWKEHRPDVTLLDLRMPELDGVDAIKAIRADDEKARIIVLTTFDSDEDIYRAIQAGAKGYLLKVAWESRLRQDECRQPNRSCCRGDQAGPDQIVTPRAPLTPATDLNRRLRGEIVGASLRFN
jgi:DNA-binding NarL/FixJ family response regulator